jgi:predicted RNase H-like HicB family nuclease
MKKLMTNDNYLFPAVVEKGEKGFGVYFVDLPGCIATGTSLQGAIEKAKGALALHLWGLEQDWQTIPEATPLDKVSVGPRETLCLLEINMFPIRAAMKNRPVKKTLTIPWYLNELAEEKRVNFSQLLQNALKEKLQVM